MTSECTATNLDHAIAAYLAGDAYKVAAREFKVGEKQLRNALVAQGIWRSAAESRQIAARKMAATLVARSPVAEETEEIVNLYLCGVSVKELAQRFGVSRTVIKHRLKASGLVVRDRSEAMLVRMANTSPEERSRLASAAHEAARGRVKPEAEKIRAARTRQERRTNASDQELLFAEWLKGRGIKVTPQLAIGPYNTDIGTDSVAVEIYGGGWHSAGDHAQRSPQRFRYLLDRGLTIVVIWTDKRRYPLGIKAADYVASLIEQSSSDPTMRGKYWVIRGDGQEVAAGETDINKLTLKPANSRRQRPGS